MGATTVVTTHSDGREHLFRLIAAGVTVPSGAFADLSVFVRRQAVEAVPVLNRRDPRALRSAPTADAAARAGGLF
jgi:hypothetical protein